MRRKRFGRIKQAIKNGATGGYLDKYKTYMSGGTPVTRVMPPRNGTKRFMAHPFGMPVTNNDWFVLMTGRADSARSGFGCSDAVLNLSAVTPTTASRPDWEPSKVVVKKMTGTNMPKTSDITGLKYQKQGGDSYTMPFGAAGTKEEFVVQNEIMTAISTSGLTCSVTFRPERIYRAG